MTLRYDLLRTPVGLAIAVLSEDGVLALRVTSDDPEWALELLARAHGIAPAHAPGAAAALDEQLAEYFAGDRRAFTVPLDWGLTRDFARTALQRVCEIPYGETAAYGEIAAAAGRPRAARAVGTACRTTPLSLVVPVHRVVRADGSLGEYGSQPETKRFLVDLERARRRHETENP
ncbi:methylated-DNA--[protein]-cysteine S-methyltransferase [Microbacterium album]|uniref:methylated-DNA--[protein]-cysteine S-methyltransferase n=1 Tax=Microbacterium album TaxID=2053191 RepID=A0A917IFL1_9MICO|nr:methylated-DNA--[protein]-cysteine S-methyltransferase [Microbacterium album]GGH43969.1 methylated-DNA--protein-cysteine methyltransferase [Microbacterium album]